MDRSADFGQWWGESVPPKLNARQKEVLYDAES